MTITERHEMQQDIGLFNTLNARGLRGAGKYFDTRRLLARNMRQARRLNDQDLQRIAATLPK